MDPDYITWTGALAPYLDDIFYFILTFLGSLIVVQLALGIVVLQIAAPIIGFRTGDRAAEVTSAVGALLKWSLLVLIGLAAIYVIALGLMPTLEERGIIGEIVARLWPVWAALAITLVLGWIFRSKLGAFGKLYGSTVGMVGFTVVLFWIFTAIFADTVAPFGAQEAPSDVMSNRILKKSLPGVLFPVDYIEFLQGAAAEGESLFRSLLRSQAEGLELSQVYLLGGDNSARDIFSRVVHGSRVVLVIAPAATLIAYMVGITLGLPAGYYTGRIDTILSFLANLVLAFPVILLFYLLVTPEISAPDWDTWTGLPSSIPIVLAGLFFFIPIIFFCTMWFTKFEKNKTKLIIYMGLTIGIGSYLFFSLVFGPETVARWGLPSGDEFEGGPEALAVAARNEAQWWATNVFPLSLAPNELNVFAAVVFASSPGVFRIVRGLTMDIKTRDYVAAAQTRGERPWYIMLWEILPNARGPLIVDACLRIGYTTILLGTLGFFGLGLDPLSPDWGSMINHGRPFVRAEWHLAIVPAIALMTLVLGLNLLADGLREESLKD